MVASSSNSKATHRVIRIGISRIGIKVCIYKGLASRDTAQQRIWILIRSTAKCSNFLCPDTLACVHFPHHCPCPHATVEEKVELGEGIKICASKGGFKQAETARKIELARKGLL